MRRGVVPARVRSPGSTGCRAPEDFDRLYACSLTGRRTFDVVHIDRAVDAAACFGDSGDIERGRRGQLEFLHAPVA